MTLPEDQTTADQRSSRRRLLRTAGVVAGGAVATAAGVAAASSAQAAPGEPVRLGRLNTSGTSTTTIRSSAPVTLDVQNRGPGDAIVASAGHHDAAAVRATRLNPEQILGMGAAVVAEGHLAPGVMATTFGAHDPAILAKGFVDETYEWGNAIHAIGTVYLTGPVYIEGDLVVNGTLYCDDVRPLSDRERSQVAERTALTQQYIADQPASPAG